MFGYLQVQRSELLVRESEAYKAVYCELCRQMGKDYSFSARFTLSYDCTFYAVLLMSLSGDCIGFRDGKCVCNPLKKCKFAVCCGESFHKAAAFSVISAYYKITDDIQDEKFFKKFLKRIIKPLFSHWHKKAARLFPKADEAVRNMMTLQYKAEHDDCSGIDSSAHPTAQMLAEVFSIESADESQGRILYEFGYHLGRWIYLIDAADDIEEDKKSGNYNPFVDKTTGKALPADYITAVLNQSLARAYDAYNLIDTKDFKGILDNMMLLGFPAAQNKVTSKLTTEVINDQSI